MSNDITAKIPLTNTCPTEPWRSRTCSTKPWRSRIGEQYISNFKHQESDHSKIKLIDFRKDILEPKHQAGLDNAIKLGLSKLGNVFYITGMVRPDAVFNKGVRIGFKPRISSPTPAFNTVCYKYNKGEVTFLWALPDKERTIFLYNNRYSIDVARHPLLPFVIEAVEGKLLLKAKLDNKEI